VIAWPGFVLGEVHMLRAVMVAALIVSVSSARVYAQDTTITVTASSADVYKSPSTGSPVIGHAARGTQLPVTRELGSWVRVVWPSSPDGVGFVHVTMGRLVNGRPADEVRASAGDAVKAIPDKTAALAPPATNASATVITRTAARPTSTTPVPHNLGIGGGMIAGSPVGFGVTARAWRWNRLGVRFDMSRQAQGVTAASQATSLQFEPSALLSLSDLISNYVWLRPYVGGGVSLRHQTLSTGLTGPGSSTSDNSTGFQVFGGTEVTIANAPQLALSTDLIYRSRREAFAAFDVGGLGVGLSAHWYFR
jgi:opacity protein-like surface antigen